MSKLDEKHIEKTHKSAAGQEDKAFEEWVSQRVLDETAEMITGLENDPNLDDFEPPEELFQKIAGIAKERGLLAEDDETTEDETEEIVEKIELSDDVKEIKKLKEMETVQDINYISNEKLRHRAQRRHFAFKWAAMIVITILGVFGVSMSSQANRAYVMQKVDEIFGNDVNTKVKNSEDIIISDTKEEVDREVIENELGVVLPTFYYFPDGMKYIKYSIDKDAQAAYIQYEYQNQFIYLQVLANSYDASGIYRNDKGSLESEFSSDWVNINAELWKIEAEGDEIPTYLAQWDYKNSFYSIFGKITKDEMINIVKDVIY